MLEEMSGFPVITVRDSCAQSGTACAGRLSAGEVRKSDTVPAGEAGKAGEDFYAVQIPDDDG